MDDAIVMLENIVRYMEMGKRRYEAALLASKEIGFTIVSMTLSLIAVFIPVLFLGGMVGRLLHEFSVTIIVAILISGFVSLTFTPMLGSRYLPPHHRKHGALYRGLESGFNRIAGAYELQLARRPPSQVRHDGRRSRNVRRHHLHLHDDADRIYSEPGRRIHFRRSMAGQDISYQSMAERQRR